MTSRIILITGANSGVGYATTKVLADAPDKFQIIMSGRSLEKVEKAKAEIEATGINGTLSTLQLDVTDDASIEKAAKHVEQQFGRLDVLINNAGVSGQGSGLKARLQQCLDTNVIGVALVADAFRPLLLKAGGNAYSIYVTSGAGSLSMAADPALKLDNDEAYRTSKAAVNMLAVLEHRDYQARGIKSFAMCPGFVRSNLSTGNTEAEGAADPATSGKLALEIITGERDADAGKYVRGEGQTWAW